ncbi:MAG: hypothetical protein E7Z87_02435 [Cyanobacteria bacterium SIG26]|nr:hypothetical protein [Cyanobacteria bacterium SIG26]
MVNNYNKHIEDVNECTSRGTCSVSPSIAALQEVAFLMLQQISHYILLLEQLGARNESVSNRLAISLASLVSVNEFSDTQLFSIIKNEYFLLKNTKETYLNLCKTSNILPKRLKNGIKFFENTSLPQAIALGEKIILDRYKKYDNEQKNLIIILEMILKSVCFNISNLLDFGENESSSIDFIINILDLFNHNKINSQKLIQLISELSVLDGELQLKISELLLDKFDGLSETNVSHSTAKGKAILVSGNNFFDLLKLLEATKDIDIDVYTHSNLLIAHSLNKFKEFANLKGHFGDKTENCLIDFAIFPGAILLTKNSVNNTEYYYRGRLFTTDYIVPQGVIKIENNNFGPLIEASKNAKGFMKGKIKPDSVVGYNFIDLERDLDVICTKFNNQQIKHLYFVGIDAHLEIQKEYFNDFFKELNDDEFVISFSYSSYKDNVLTIPVGNYTPVVSKILVEIFNKISIEDERITFFFTTCDVMSVSGLIMLKKHNAKSLYMVKCPPMLINPSVYATLQSKYNVKTTTVATKDLDNIRNKKSTQ